MFTEKFWKDLNYKISFEKILELETFFEIYDRKDIFKLSGKEFGTLYLFFERKPYIFLPIDIIKNNIVYIKKIDFNLENDNILEYYNNFNTFPLTYIDIQKGNFKINNRNLYINFSYEFFERFILNNISLVDNIENCRYSLCIYRYNINDDISHHSKDKLLNEKISYKIFNKDNISYGVLKLDKIVTRKVLKEGDIDYNIIFCVYKLIDPDDLKMVNKNIDDYDIDYLTDIKIPEFNDKLVENRYTLRNEVLKR